MRGLRLLIVGIVSGVVAGWFPLPPPASADTTAQPTTNPLAITASPAPTNSPASSSAPADWRLRPENLEKELTDTGRVIRHKVTAVGEKLSEELDDAAITDKIKTKLVAEPRLAAWNVGVVTTHRVVTLSGRVDTLEDIGRAIQLALETEGVSQVISTIHLGNQTPGDKPVPATP